MTSILFQIGRELVNEVQAGIKAHNDVKEGKPVERREDKWGDPMAPKTVYSIVRGVEEQLGMGKGKGKQAEAGPSASDKEDQVAKGEGVVDLAVSNVSDKKSEHDSFADSLQPTPSEPGPSSSPATASLSTPDQGTKAEVSDLDTAIQSGISSPPSYASAINDTPGTSSAVRSSSEEPVRPSEKAEHPKAIGQPSSLDRIQLDALGVPLPRESGLTTEHRPPPPPPPTRADKIHKHLETADEVAAEIALGVLIGHVLDGPTQTLVEGLMSIEDDETPQSKKVSPSPSRGSIFNQECLLIWAESRCPQGSSERDRQADPETGSSRQEIGRARRKAGRPSRRAIREGSTERPQAAQGKDGRGQEGSDQD